MQEKKGFDKDMHRKIIHCTCSDNVQKLNTGFPGQDDTCMNEAAAAGCRKRRTTCTQSHSGTAAQLLCTNTQLMSVIKKKKLPCKYWFDAKMKTCKLITGTVTSLHVFSLKMSLSL